MRYVLLCLIDGVSNTEIEPSLYRIYMTLPMNIGIIWLRNRVPMRPSFRLGFRYFFGYPSS